MSKKFRVLENNKKNFTKEEREARRLMEEKATDGFNKLQNSAPNHLDNVARAEYERVVKELQKLPVRNIDRTILESYCSWYSVYRQAETDVKEYGIFMHYENEETGETVIDSSKKNPAITIMKEATAELKSSASSLGMTVDSRMKMFVPEKEKKKETMFDKFG